MHFSRTRCLRGGATAGLALMGSGVLAGTSFAATRPPDAPHLPPGFSKTFTSRFVDAGGLRQHIVIGGDGPPLLLVHGWPENWYQYRALMPALARDHTVIAVDQRGMGLTESRRAATTPPRWPTTSSRSWTRSAMTASPSSGSTPGW